MNRRHALVGTALLAVAPKAIAAQDDIAVRFLDAQLNANWDALTDLLHPDFTPEFQRLGEETQGRDDWIARQREQPPSEFTYSYQVISQAEQGEYRHLYAVVDIDMGSSGVLRAPYVSVIKVQDGLIIGGTGGLLTDHLK